MEGSFFAQSDGPHISPPESHTMGTEGRRGGHTVTARNTPGERAAWRISRRFDGARDPEALVRALIQAHKR